MQTITTLRNGHIYQMDIAEAIDIMQQYAEDNTGGDLLQACQQMQYMIDDLNTRERVAFRRFMRDMGQLLAPVDN